MAQPQSTTPIPHGTIRMSSTYTRQCADCGTVLPPGHRHHYVKQSGDRYLCIPCAVNSLPAQEVA